MKLQDILDQLTYGELQSVKLGGSQSKGITTENYPEIMSHINLALTDLHTRFELRQETVKIDLQDNISLYRLDSKYAISNTSSTATTKYISDTVDDPFNDNVLLIKVIKDELNNEYRLNDSDDCDSIRIPVYNGIDVPNPKTGKTLTIAYQADHPRINVNSLEPSFDIDIPFSLVHALLLFVKHRVYSSMSSLEAHSLSQSAYQEYLIEIDRIDNEGLIHEDNIKNNAFKDGQWV